MFVKLLIWSTTTMIFVIKFTTKLFNTINIDILLFFNWGFYSGNTILLIYICWNKSLFETVNISTKDIFFIFRLEFHYFKGQLSIEVQTPILVQSPLVWPLWWILGFTRRVCEWSTDRRLSGVPQEPLLTPWFKHSASGSTKCTSIKKLIIFL